MGGIQAIAGDPMMNNFSALVDELRCSINMCSWAGYESLQQSLVTAVRNSGAFVCGETALASPYLSAEDHKICALRSAELIKHEALSGASVAPFSASSVISKVPRPQKADLPHRRMRIGFLGRSFYAQSTTYLMVGVIEYHDREHLEYIAYDMGQTRSDQMATRILGAFDGVCHVEDWTNEEIAQKIALDHIDILVFLHAPTDPRCGVLAFHPAKFQLAYLYYPGSFGSPLVDGIVSDAVVTPGYLEKDFSETVLRLPICYQPNDPERSLGSDMSRETLGLPSNAVVLGYFGQSYKITPRIFGLWCALLRENSQSVLWLLAESPDVKKNLRLEAVRRGVSADRLYFAGLEPTAQHISRLRMVDVALDTFPYGGHTGTSDALWAGTPVVTKIGRPFASRVAASLLKAVGLHALVTHSDAEYLMVITSLIRDHERRLSIRRYLIKNRDLFILFNIKNYVREFENLMFNLT